VILVVISAGCGQGGTETNTAAPETTPPIESTFVPFREPDDPTLPSAEERIARVKPDFIDPDGCPRMGPNGESICPAPADPGRPDVSGQAFYGYLGPNFDASATSGGISVLTVTTRMDGGSAVVTGVVRNETGVTLDAIDMHVDLVDSTGAVRATGRGASVLGSVRHGEPAPFEIAITVPVGSPDLVAQVTASPGSGARTERRMAITVGWEAMPGDERYVVPGEGLGDRPPGPPYPYTLDVTMTNEGDTHLEAVELIVGFLDREGHLRWLEHRTVVPPAGEVSPGAAALWQLSVSDQADFDDVVGTDFARAIWVMGLS
jgi:hypothetical protein